MPLYIKDNEVAEMASRLASIRRITKTEAVRLALKSELAREQAKPSLVDIGVEFCRNLRARGNPETGKPADKNFRDGLYEND
jgi:antitoxin VapB